MRLIVTALLGIIPLCFLSGCDETQGMDYETAQTRRSDFEKRFPEPLSGQLDSTKASTFDENTNSFCWSFFISRETFNQVKGANPHVLLYMGMHDLERCFILVPADEYWKPIANGTESTFAMLGENGLCPRFCDIASTAGASSMVDYASVKEAANGFFRATEHTEHEHTVRNAIRLDSGLVNPILRRDPYMKIAFGWYNEEYSIVGFGVNTENQEDREVTIKPLGLTDFVRDSLPDVATLETITVPGATPAPR